MPSRKLKSLISHNFTDTYAKPPHCGTAIASQERKRIGNIPITPHSNLENNMKTKAAATKTGVTNPSTSTTDTKIYSVTLAVVGLFASAVGIWAFACLVGGMIAGGGPLGLVTGWFKAVNGL